MDDRNKQPEQVVLATSRGGVISAKGTADGVVLRIDSRVDWKDLIQAVNDFLEPRKNFLSGHKVSIEWIGGTPPEEAQKSVISTLHNNFSIYVSDTIVRDIKLAGSKTRISEEEVVDRDKVDNDFEQIDANTYTEDHSNLFMGIGEVLSDDSHSANEARLSDRFISRGLAVKPIESQSVKQPITDSSLWDMPDARIIYSTLRSGQKIESEHSVIIIGDINPGAEVVSGGDIIVLGNLRGLAHAGAYEESGGGRFIFALNLDPMQLRIGCFIGRGSDKTKPGSVETSCSPEIAKVEGNTIVVQPFFASTRKDVRAKTYLG